MAIQIRRGTDSEWESNKSNIVAGEPAVTLDSERMFVGTGSGTYMELANLDVLADAFDSSASYEVGDFVAYHGKVYKCNTDHSGAWNASDFDEVALADALDSLGEDVYTKAEADALLALKADASDVNSALALKADKSDTYTKTEVNTALALKADKSDTYTKTETYTKAQVDSIVEDAIAEAVKESEYSNFEMKSVSGDFIHITDGAGLIPVKDLKIGIDAVQDLHGYDAPWVGGAGKNKWHSDWTFDDLNVNKIDGVVTVKQTINTTYLLGNSTSPLDFVLPAGTYTLSAYSSTFGGIYATLSDNSTWNNGETKTFAEAVTIINIRCNNRGLNAGTYTWRLQIESGSEVTSYAPWENICPISGWTGAKVTVSDIPPVDIVWDENSDGKYIGASGTIGNSDGFHYSEPLPVNPKKYIYTFTTSLPNGITTRVHGYDSNGTWVKQLAFASVSQGTRTTSIEFEVTSDIAFIKISNTENATEQSIIPAIKTVYSISWETEAGTVYGGTLDVTTGELVVKHQIVDLGNLNWTDQSSQTQKSYYSEAISNAMQADLNYGETAISSCYKLTNSSGFVNIGDGRFIISSSHRINCNDNRFENANAFKTGIAGETVMYKLVEPITYTIDPTEVLTLLGENNIFADTGAVEELIYRISRQ